MKLDPRVDSYIERAQPFAQSILGHVRERVGAALPEAEETIRWGGPAYTLDGKLLLMAHAFKEHAALNFWRGQELRGQSAVAEGMGQFGKLRSVSDLPPDAELERMIREAAELSRRAPAPRQTKHAPKAEPAMHSDFAAALDKAPQAKAALDGFPPGARREYLEWIADAKQDGTRHKRIATAIEWLSDGKRRNWKYERC